VLHASAATLHNLGSRSRIDTICVVLACSGWRTIQPGQTPYSHSEKQGGKDVYGKQQFHHCIIPHVTRPANDDAEASLRRTTQSRRRMPNL